MTPLALATRSDERLATQVAGGNDAAFDAIYRRYEASLFGYCRSITRNADDAGDALQNAMLKALLALRREERSAPLRPWLFRIVHNEAVNQVTRRPVVAAPQSDTTHAAVAGADEQAATRERVAEIVSDLRELPLRQRAALVMRELGDLDYPEIALALDVSENNARQLVFAARTSLKERQAGRGLSCDSVRDMILLSDARRLRKRPVRAHLRSCEECRAFAEADPRRPRSRAAGLLPWAPLDWLLRALGGGGASAAGGAALAGGGGIVVKAAATAAVLTAGLGVADAAREHEAGAPATKRETAAVARTGNEVAHATEEIKAVTAEPRQPTAAPRATTSKRATAATNNETAETSDGAGEQREADQPREEHAREDRNRQPYGGDRSQSRDDSYRDGHYEQRSGVTYDGGHRGTAPDQPRQQAPTQDGTRDPMQPPAPQP